MALFGRESDADQRRAERVRLWAQARSPQALFSVMLGLLAVVDFFTPIGFIGGVAAIVLGVRARRHIRLNPHLLGGRLAMAGIVLGAVGIVLSVAFHIKFL